MNKFTRTAVTVVGVGAALGIIGGLASSGGDEKTEKPNTTISVPSPSATKSPAPKKTEAKKTQAQELQACIAASGTPAEKTAAKHITKVTGVGEGSIQMVEIFTDYAGSLMTGDAPKGKVLASAFSSCHQSKSGKSLVTVYNKDGEILSNGNF